MKAPTPQLPSLDRETLQAIQRAYRAIREQSGYGRISIRIEYAGESRESHFVALEIEKKTK